MLNVLGQSVDGSGGPGLLDRGAPQMGKFFMYCWDRILEFN